MLQALLGIRQMLDLAGNVEWFVAHNVQAVFLALHAFIFRTTDPSVPGAPFTNAQPIRRFTPSPSGHLASITRSAPAARN